MAYSRFGHGSHVYVWPGGEIYDPQIFCSQCKLLTGALNETFEASSPKEMIDHLFEHQSQGDNVDDALWNIRADYNLENAKKFFDYVNQIQ
jgi:hypothetical protein